MEDALCERQTNLKRVRRRLELRVDSRGIRRTNQSFAVERIQRQLLLLRATFPQPVIFFGGENFFEQVRVKIFDDDDRLLIQQERVVSFAERIDSPRRAQVQTSVSVIFAEDDGDFGKIHVQHQAAVEDVFKFAVDERNHTAARHVAALVEGHKSFVRDAVEGQLQPVREIEQRGDSRARVVQKIFFTRRGLFGGRKIFLKNFGEVDEHERGAQLFCGGLITRRQHI